jgi:hypothetical protein
VKPLHGHALRRAILGGLLVAGRPLTAREVVAELHAHGVTVYRTGKSASRQVGDMLAYQSRAGRVERVAPGRYRLTWPMSRSTRWRYRRWFEAIDDGLC